MPLEKETKVQNQECALIEIYAYILHQCMLYILHLPGQKVCLSDFNCSSQLDHKSLLSWLVWSSSIFRKRMFECCLYGKTFPFAKSNDQTGYNFLQDTMSNENPNGSILLKCRVLRIHGAHFYQGRVQRTELT